MKMNILIAADKQTEHDIARCLLGNMMDPQLGRVHEITFASTFMEARSALIAAPQTGRQFDVLLSAFMLPFSNNPQELALTEAKDLRRMFGYPLLNLAQFSGVRAIALVMTSFEGLQQPESGVVQAIGEGLQLIGEDTRVLTVLHAPQAYVHLPTCEEVDRESYPGDGVVAGIDWLTILSDLLQID